MTSPRADSAEPYSWAADMAAPMKSYLPPIAITGATGFIGSAVARRLSAAGYRLRALVRPGSIHKASGGFSAERILGDLEDVPSLRRLLGSGPLCRRGPRGRAGGF